MNVNLILQIYNNNSLWTERHEKYIISSLKKNSKLNKSSKSYKLVNVAGVTRVAKIDDNRIMATKNDVFTIINDIHVGYGHKGVLTYKHIYEHYANIPKAIVKSFIQECEECRNLKNKLHKTPDCSADVDSNKTSQLRALLEQQDKIKYPVRKRTYEPSLKLTMERHSPKSYQNKKKECNEDSRVVQAKEPEIIPDYSIIEPPSSNKQTVKYTRRYTSRKIKQTNFENSCRLCLSTKNCANNIFATILVSASSDNTWAVDVVMQLAPVKISKDDGLSPYICDSCIDQLEQFVQFRKRCVHSEKILKERGGRWENSERKIKKDKDNKMVANNKESNENGSVLKNVENIPSVPQICPDVPATELYQHAASNSLSTDRNVTQLPNSKKKRKRKAKCKDPISSEPNDKDKEENINKRVKVDTDNPDIDTNYLIYSVYNVKDETDNNRNTDFDTDTNFQMNHGYVNEVVLIKTEPDIELVEENVIEDKLVDCNAMDSIGITEQINSDYLFQHTDVDNGENVCVKNEIEFSDVTSIDYEV